MAWPTPPLNVEVSLALGADLTAAPSSWSWTALDRKVYNRSPLVIQRGRQNEQSSSGPSHCTLTLDNRAGSFSPRNPVGAYYGQIGRNTPLRVRVNPGSGFVTRFVGYVSEWPQRWDPSEKDFWVTVRADGIMRRLGQGSSPLKSAPRRYLSALTGGDEPVAAWTLEDGPLIVGAVPLFGDQALTPRSGVHPSGAVVTYPLWGKGDLGPWLPPVLSRSGGADLTIIVATVTMPAFSTTWTVDMMYASGTDAGSDTVDAVAATVDINPSYLMGSAAGWPQLQFVPVAQEIKVAMNGEPETSTIVPGLYDGLGHHIRWTATQSGGNVTWTVYIDGTAQQVDTTAGAMTLTAVEWIGLVAAGQSGARLAEGYVAVWTTPPALADAAAAALGHVGETAGARFARLCAEESVTADVVGTDTQTMGPQGTLSLPDLLQECEAASAGLVTERRTGELGLDLAASRYNQTAALTLNYAAGNIAPTLEPTDDDQLTRNVVTVTRTGGSPVAVAATSGRLGPAIGRYEDTVAVNVESDPQAANHASWRVHLGTVDEWRFPRMVLDLRRNASLLPAWLAADVGSLVRLTNVPDRISYDDIDLIIEGYAETLASEFWIVELNCSPGKPWTVGELDDSTLGRLDTGGSTTTEALDTTETGIDVTSPGAVWSTLAEPYDVLIGGELMTVTTCTGAGPGQTFTVTRSVNGVVKADSSGVAAALAIPLRLAL